MTRCPRCGGAISDSASACAGCARPVTLDLTARVPRKTRPQSRRPILRDTILLLGGIGGIVAASTSDNWWIAGGIFVAALLAALVAQYL
jgi:hypothetical protein